MASAEALEPNQHTTSRGAFRRGMPRPDGPKSGRAILHRNADDSPAAGDFGLCQLRFQALAGPWTRLRAAPIQTSPSALKSLKSPLNAVYFAVFFAKLYVSDFPRVARHEPPILHTARSRQFIERMFPGERFQRFSTLAGLSKRPPPRRRSSRRCERPTGEFGLPGKKTLPALYIEVAAVNYKFVFSARGWTKFPQHTARLRRRSERQ